LSVFDLVYLLLSPLVLIVTIFNPKKWNLLYKKFSRDYLKTQFEQNGDNRCFWVHAASVGEIKLALRLIKEWSKNQAELRFILTTNTATGLETARKTAIVPSYIAPFDFSWSIKAFLKHTGITDLILIETEIWPNLISVLSERGEVIIVNGRLSDRRMWLYRVFKKPLRSALSKVGLVLAGDQKSAERFRSFGVEAGKIKFYGNSKFELPAKIVSEKQKGLQKEYNLSDKQFIVVAGSIQPEELTEILKGWETVTQKTPQARLILIPRHPEKEGEFQRILNANNFPDYYTASPDNTPSKEQTKIYLIAQMGVLKSWYSLADVIFVGGSLCDRGGQNMLEAVALNKPVCIGPETPNFQQEVDILLKAKGLKIIKNGDELSSFVEWVITDSPEVRKMAENGFLTIKKHSGALAKNIEHLNRFYQFSPHSSDDKQI
jgi:3-deoxy-D-manno-octulosonic-acid transferase